MAKIAQVKGVGIKGYKVEFSILDLYKMQQLAYELDTMHHGEVGELSALIHKLFAKTVGETNKDWDFLTEEEGAE